MVQVIKWGIGKRVYTGGVLGVVIGSMLAFGVAIPKSGTLFDLPIFFATIGIFVMLSVAMSFETRFDAQRGLIEESVVILGIRLALLKSRVSQCEPIALDYISDNYRRSRAIGWHLGLVTCSGRVIYFAYSERREELLEKADHWRGLVESPS